MPLPYCRLLWIWSRFSPSVRWCSSTNAGQWSAERCISTSSTASLSPIGPGQFWLVEDKMVPSTVLMYCSTDGPLSDEQSSFDTSSSISTPNVGVISFLDHLSHWQTGETDFSTLWRSSTKVTQQMFHWGRSRWMAQLHLLCLWGDFWRRNKLQLLPWPHKLLILQP